jgi:DNA polymerase III alpha subunit
MKVSIDLNALPLNDKLVFEDLTGGFTKGVFQAASNPLYQFIN